MFSYLLLLKALQLQGSLGLLDEYFFSYILFIIIIGGILVLFIYITRLASKEVISTSNRIHREVGRAKDLPAPLVTAFNAVSKREFFKVTVEKFS